MSCFFFGVGLLILIYEGMVSGVLVIGIFVLSWCFVIVMLGFKMGNN